MNEKSEANAKQPNGKSDVDQACHNGFYIRWIGQSYLDMSMFVVYLIKNQTDRSYPNKEFWIWKMTFG